MKKEKEKPFFKKCIFNVGTDGNSELAGRHCCTVRLSEVPWLELRAGKLDKTRRSLDLSGKLKIKKNQPLMFEKIKK